MSQNIRDRMGRSAVRGPTEHLEACWLMEEGRGSSIHDVSANTVLCKLNAGAAAWDTCWRAGEGEVCCVGVSVRWTSVCSRWLCSCVCVCLCGCVFGTPSCLCRSRKRSSSSPRTHSNPSAPRSPPVPSSALLLSSCGEPPRLCGRRRLPSRCWPTLTASRWSTCPSWSHRPPTGARLTAPRMRRVWVRRPSPWLRRCPCSCCCTRCCTSSSRSSCAPSTPAWPTAPRWPVATCPPPSARQRRRQLRRRWPWRRRRSVVCSWARARR